MKESRPDIHSPQTKPSGQESDNSRVKSFGENTSVKRDKTADEFSERIEKDIDLVNYVKWRKQFLIRLKSKITAWKEELK